MSLPRDTPVFAPKASEPNPSPDLTRTPGTTYSGVIIVGRRAPVHQPTFSPKGTRHVPQ